MNRLRVLNKKFLMHWAIIGSFLLYLVSADYIFDRMLTVKGESKLQHFDLPKDTNKIKISIDKFNNSRREWKELIYILGWAFVKGQDATNDDTYLVLQSKDKTYIFDTVPMKRRGVTKVFGRSTGLNLDNSGFQAYIPDGVIKKGRYAIGIYIQNHQGRFFTVSHRYSAEKTEDGSIIFCHNRNAKGKK